MDTPKYGETLKFMYIKYQPTLVVLPKVTATRAGTYPCQQPRCRTCGHISSETDLLGPKDHLTIRDSFTCLSSSLIYCISCRRCPAIREFKQSTTAGATTAAVTEKVWGEYVSVVC